MRRKEVTEILAGECVALYRSRIEQFSLWKLGQHLPRWFIEDFDEAAALLR